MASIFSNSAAVGGRPYAQNYDVGGVNYFAPTEGDQWMAGINAQAAQSNAQQPSGGRGGGGYGGGTIQDPSGDFFNPNRQGWVTSPTGYLAGLQNQQKQQHWTQVMGMLGGMMNQSPFQIGGSSGTGPQISVGGVYNPQQIEQQVNAARAGNDQSAATQQRGFANEAAGRGFASGSPLIAAMNQQIAGSNMATNASSEQSIRQNAAQMNADQTLKSQQAAESQYASRQQEDIQRLQPYYQRQNALIAALAGLA